MEENKPNDNLPSSKTNDVPNQINQILEEASPKDREEIEKITQTFAMMSGESPESSIMKKITPEHITQYLNDSKENMELSFKDKKSNKKFIFCLVIVALVFILIIIVLLKDNPTLLQNIIYSVISFVAGALGGYSFGRHKQSED